MIQYFVNHCLLPLTCITHHIVFTYENQETTNIQTYILLKHQQHAVHWEQKCSQPCFVFEAHIQGWA